jgi:hypothetical protein
MRARIIFCASRVGDRVPFSTSVPQKSNSTAFTIAPPIVSNKHPYKKYAVKMSYPASCRYRRRLASRAVFPDILLNAAERLHITGL